MTNYTTIKEYVPWHAGIEGNSSLADPLLQAVAEVY